MFALDTVCIPNLRILNVADKHIQVVLTAKCAGLDVSFKLIRDGRCASITKEKNQQERQLRHDHLKQVE